MGEVVFLVVIRFGGCGELIVGFFLHIMKIRYKFLNPE